MADKYDDLYTLACCIQSQVLDLIEQDPVLNVPRFGGITHAGEGFCCDSLWIKLQPTLFENSFNPGEDKCAYSVTERFDVVWAIPACSERLFFEDCGEEMDVCEDGEEGCPEPTHAIGDGKCGDTTPSIRDETAYIWRARSLLRRDLACRVQCCAEGPAGQCCVSVRCKSVRPVAMSQETEGGCAYLTLTLEARL